MTNLGRFLSLILAFVCASIALSQQEMEKSESPFKEATCTACHGPNAMGGIGPPLVKVELKFDEFKRTVRNGRTAMPSFSSDKVSDEQIQAVFDQVQAMPWIDEELPDIYSGESEESGSGSVWIYALGGVIVVAGAVIYFVQRGK